MALLGVLACLLGLAATWVLAELVPIVHYKDALVLYDLTQLNRPFVEAPANVLLDLLFPPFFAIWTAILVLLAWRARRRALALAFVVVLPLAPLSAELLKPLLAHPHDQIGYQYVGNESWPSGHATAATVLVWAAVLLAPPARRRLVGALAVLLALTVGAALLVLAWHMPSDVIGGYLLATLWIAAMVAVLCAREVRGSPEQDGERLTSGSLPGAARAVRPGSP